MTVRTPLVVLVVLCLSHVGLAAQTVTVNTYLLQIAKGWTSDAKKALPDLLIDRPDDPAVMYLHASLVEDPKRALPLYERIVERYANSEWADDAMLRIVIQACAAKDNAKATKSFQQMRQLYPNSELLTVAYDVMRSSVGVPPPETATTAPAPEPRTPAPTPQPTATGQLPTSATHPYTLDITTTTDKKEAEGMVAKYSAKNLRVDYAEKWVKGKRNYVVQAGWYATEVDAASDLEAVRKVCNCKPLVARRMP